jgi:hypothetical protein
MRVLFHESDFFVNCLLIFLVQEVHRILRPFDCEYLLVMLPDGSENITKASHPDKMVLVWLKGIGLTAFLGNTIY